ncbi:hypothetical protein EMMF5_004239 [Cystobasidiomycetes sp. EMM_F5]
MDPDRDEDFYMDSQPPTAFPNQLRKSFKLEVDALCFDLEDSVASERKVGARETVL